MNKMEDLINMTKLNELLNKKEEVEEKKTSKVVWIFAIIGIVAAAIYGIYRFFTPDYLEDFEDDFEDDFDDDFFEDDDDEEAPAKSEDKEETTED
jgi:flagellar basal body-associated protein FliL